MHNLNIVGTGESPEIHFDFDKGIFRINGRLVSVASTNNKFFIPLIQKVNEYAKSPCEETKLFIEMEYCSSAGLKNLYQLLRIFDQIYQEGKTVSFEWRFFLDDEDGKDKGMYFKKLLHMPVKLVMYNNE